MVLDFHSKSQQVLTPFGYTCSELPKEIEDINSLGQIAVNTINGFNEWEFTLGSSCKDKYEVKGGARGRNP